MKREKVKKPAVIVVGNHVTSLNIMRQLSGVGCECYLVHNSGVNICRFSKYCNGFLKSPSFGDISNMMGFLINLARKPKFERAVLIPTNDDAVVLLSKNKEKLEKYFFVPVPGWEIIKKAYDKRITLKIAEREGLPIPKSIFPSNLTETLEKINQLKYPVVLKPAMGKKYYFATRKKMHRADSQDELVFYFKKIAKIVGEENILVQEYIPGPMSELYNYSALIKDGRTYGVYTGKKIRQHPRDFGVGTAAKTVSDPELTKIGTDLLLACNYEGLGYIEFKKDFRDNKYKLMEINPRLWNFLDLPYVTGVNLPLNLYLYALGEEIFDKHSEGNVIWIHIWTDFGETIKEVFKGRENLWEYFRSLKGVKKYAVASWDDPLPFIMETLLLPLLLFKR